MLSVRLRGFMECEGVLPTTSSLIEKVLAFVMPFCAWHTLYSVLWRLRKRLDLFRSTPVPLLTGSTIGDSLQALLSGS